MICRLEFCKGQLLKVLVRMMTRVALISELEQICEQQMASYELAMVVFLELDVPEPEIHLGRISLLPVDGFQSEGQACTQS